MKERFENYLLEAMKKNASDVHLSINSKPVMRIDGSLLRYTEKEMDKEEMENIAKTILTESQLAVFQDKGEVDLSYVIGEGTRLRVNVYRQMDAVSVAARIIPREVPSFDSLDLPKILKKIAKNDKGLVLVTGPTGSGKSSTLAAIIDFINETSSKHIVTLEDPIEYIHKNKKCLIEQRQIGSDTKSFDNGLRAALRQDPDVILVGELRDLETVKAALTAAETGHLVLGTLHTQTAPSTIDRIIDTFPGSAQPQVRNQLANSLQAIVSQRLVKRVGGGRIAATEIMINTNAIQNLIRNEKIHQIKSVLEMSSGDGMCTLAKSVQELLEAGTISESALLELNIALNS